VFSQKTKKYKGAIIPFILVFGMVSSMILTSLLGYVTQQYKKATRQESKSNALQAAESGLNYYYWYVLHTLEGKSAAQIQAYWAGDPLGVPSYEGEVRGEGGEVISRYILEVDPPEVGSTIIMVNITGWDVKHPAMRRVVKARLRKPSWSEYSVIANDVMRFGEGTETWGPIHSNNGIRFDGVAHNLVSSEVAEYWDPDTGQTKPGVWTALPNEAEVFLAGKEYPSSHIDFSGVTVNLGVMKGIADEPGGLYVPPAPNCGYHLTLRADDKVDVARVTSCGSSTYKIYGEDAPVTHDIPSNGIIFVEDDVWIEGTIDGIHLTVAAANLEGGTPSNVYLFNDLTYTSKDGSDILGVIAQNNVSVGLYSEDNLEIDAALVAQEGRVGRNYYSWWWSPTYYKRDTITVYGAIATNRRYGFAWICGSTPCSGYDIRNLVYDNNLLYSPPPYFPTGDHYEIDLWEED